MKRVAVLLLSIAPFAGLADQEIMRGVPPSAESQVTFKNYRDYPYNKWSFHNISAVLSTLIIAREGVVRQLTDSPDASIPGLSVADGWGNPTTVERAFAENEADAVLVLKDNDILYERYYNGMGRHDPHIWFSATKSLTSTALGVLADQGKIDLAKSPADYVPELKGTGFERVTLQHVLDHSTAIDFKEEYIDPESDFLKYYGPALNFVFLPGARDVQPDETDYYGLHEFLANFIRPDHDVTPGDVFDYNSANSDALGWVIARVAGMGYEEFVQRHIWAHLGAEHDALIVADRAYMPVATGGMTTTARDAALFGQMILHRGNVAGRQIVSPSWVDRSLDVSSRDLQKMAQNERYQENSWSAYKNMWWIIDHRKGEYAAVGVHGQVIYINRDAEVVIVYFSSQPVASASRNLQFQSKLFAAQAIAAHVKNKTTQ